MKRTELIFIILFMIAIVLNLLLAPGAGLLTVLTLSMLSFIYGFFGFALFNDIRLRNIFKTESYRQISGLRILGGVAAGWALSVTLSGLLFKLQSWPNADTNLTVGVLALSIVIIVAAVKHSKRKSEFYTRIFKRAVIFGVFGLFLLLSPEATWIKIKYRNRPEVVDAFKKAMADPNNQKLQQELNYELQKAHGHVE